MIVAVIASTLIAAACLAWAWWHSTHGELHARAKRTVVVTLITGETFTGVLYSSDRDCLILRNAEAIGFGNDPRNVPVQGEAVLLRSNVAYLQAT